MWASYHHIRTTKMFVRCWEDFIMHFDAPKTPTFYQYVTDEVFKQMVKVEFAKEPEEDCEMPTTSVNVMEENTLRYTAGYVLRKCKAKIEKSSNEHKDAMLVCIEELIGVKDVYRLTELWTNTQDHGGLVHLTDEAYDFFYQMECVVREHMRIDRVDKIDEKEKESFDWSRYA